MRYLLLLPLIASFALRAQDSWQIDQAHSSAQFAIRHMMVATVRGQFGKVTGQVVHDPSNPSKSSVNATIDVKSIDTREAKRDAHLLSPDFFDAEKYPTMTFQSTKVEPAGQGELKVTGDLTIHGVTKQVVFDVEGPSPPVQMGGGKKGGTVTKSGATATTKISRKEFGLTWNRLLEAGGVTVGDEVSITIDVELNKQSN
ncbi:MAG: YceI family protein [Acidimicrobiia bacterium]|nr:YceI family protein [Acidimicrobiia bacterium]